MASLQHLIRIFIIALLVTVLVTQAMALPIVEKRNGLIHHSSFLEARGETQGKTQGPRRQGLRYKAGLVVGKGLGKAMNVVGMNPATRARNRAAKQGNVDAPFIVPQKPAGAV